MVLTLGQAAKEVGLSKPGVLKSIKDGKISAQKNEHGHWQIDPAELFRVYPPRKPVAPNLEAEFATVNPSSSNEISRLTHEVNLLSERLSDREQRIRELTEDRGEIKQEREHWRQQAERLLLAAPLHESSKQARRFSSLWIILAIALLLVGVFFVLAGKETLFSMLQDFRLSEISADEINSRQSLLFKK